MTINYKLDLSRYNLVELEILVQIGALTVGELDAERKLRGLEYDMVTPPEGESL